MRLNKYQKKWIDKLLSGTTRKAKGQLFKHGRMCCLGVAAKECGLDKKHTINCKFNLAHTETLKALKLYDCNGFIFIKNVSKKWIKKLKLYPDLQDQILNKKIALVSLNDDTNMSHVEIGKFINENRKAVFKA